MAKKKMTFDELSREVFSTPMQENSSLLGKANLESMVVMAAIRENCIGNEFKNIIKNHGTEMEVFGVIESETVASDVVALESNTDSYSTSINKYRPCEILAGIKIAQESHAAAYRKFMRANQQAQAALEALMMEFGDQAVSETDQIIENASSKLKNSSAKMRDVLNKKLK